MDEADLFGAVVADVAAVEADLGGWVQMDRINLTSLVELVDWLINLMKKYLTS